MNGILFTSRSVTLAQRIKNILDKNGIKAQIVRPDIAMTHGGCAYAVNISQTFLPEALELLKINKIKPMRVFLIDKNGYKELSV